MTRSARFRTLLGSYGADPGRWPPAERAAALALLQGSAEAGVLRDEAAALDALLDRAPRPAPPRLDAAALAARITARPQERIRPYRLQEMIWLRAVGLAAAAVIGFVVGVTEIANVNDTSDPAAITTPFDVAEVSPW